MNTPAPTGVPTPQTPPTAIGVLQALLTSWGTFKLGALLGLPTESAVIVAGGITSAITSGIHTLAQKFHWNL
jgi:hypothetical protein